MAGESTEVALPDLSGRVALVTGGSGGLGLEIVRALATAGATILMPVRDRGRGARAIAEVRQSTPDAALELYDADLSSVDSVRGLVDRLLTEGRGIDLEVMNAGIVLLGDRQRHTSADGTELHLATNFVGHFVLTTGILPLLRSTDARVVVQCSGIAQFSDIDWDDIQCERRYGPLRAYAASKVALGLFATELQRRSTAWDWGVTVKLCHPGIAPDTGIAGTIRKRLTGGATHRIVQRVSNSPRQAAQPALLAAISDAAGPSFFGPSGFGHTRGSAAPQRSYRHVTDATGGRRAWDLGLRLANVAASDAGTIP